MGSIDSRAWRALGLVVAVGLVATGCTVGGAEPAATSTAAPVTDDPSADAIASVSAERVQAAVDDLPASVEEAMDATGNPGIAVGVVSQGDVLYAEGFGVRDVDSGDPVDADTVFPLASVSKSVGATVIARAIDEGLVSWSTPVTENLEGFALSDPYATENVTIADMYSHRSGLYAHAGDELEEIGYDRDTILARMSLIPLDPFRTVFHYGNFDITAAAESVAAAAGEDWPALSERLLYQPLGMTSTSSSFADLESRENRALGHMKIDGEWQVTEPQRMPDAQTPAGGVSSSITDMTTWLTMLMADGQVDGETFIEDASLRPAISPQMVTGLPTSFGAKGSTYGYGFNVGTTVGGLVDVNHSGGFLTGTGTIVKFLPREGVGIVVLSNGSANGVSEAIAARFMDIAQFGEPRRDWLAPYMMVFENDAAPLGELVGEEPPANPEPAGDPASYAGEYANDYFGAATVTVAGDALALTLGPTGEWPLEHWSGDVFVFRPSSENAPPGTISQATFDGDTLVLEYFDQHGLGTFMR